MFIDQFQFVRWSLKLALVGRVLVLPMLNMLIPVPVLDMTSSDPVTMPGMLRSHLHAPQFRRHVSQATTHMYTCVTRSTTVQQCMCMHAREYKYTTAARG